MSKSQFSDAELAFFDEGDSLTEDTLSDKSAPAAEDFSDLDSSEDRSASWVERAMAVLSLVAPARSES